MGGPPSCGARLSWPYGQEVPGEGSHSPPPSHHSVGVAPKGCPVGGAGVQSPPPPPIHPPRGGGGPYGPSPKESGDVRSGAGVSIRVPRDPPPSTTVHTTVVVDAAVGGCPPPLLRGWDESFSSLPPTHTCPPLYRGRRGTLSPFFLVSSPPLTGRDRSSSRRRRRALAAIPGAAKSLPSARVVSSVSSGGRPLAAAPSLPVGVSPLPVRVRWGRALAAKVSLPAAVSPPSVRVSPFPLRLSSPYGEGKELAAWFSSPSPATSGHP